MEKVDDLLRIYEDLFSEMRTNSGGWDELRKRLMPRFEGLAELAERRNQTKCTADWCPDANKALQDLASAHLLFITPTDSKWFSLRPKTEENFYTSSDDWFTQATESVYKALADSNFYAVAHEVYLDRCLTGTGCMFADIRKDQGLVFTHVPTGTFAIAEDAHGQVDTLVRKLSLSAHQAAELFGESSLPIKIKRVLSNPSKRFTEKFDFVHLVLPNRQASFGSANLPSDQRKWKDIYIALEEKKIVYSGGFYEFPFLVTRFLREANSAYGYAPGLAVMPDIYTLLLIDNILNTAGMRAAMPSVIVTAEMAKEVDLRAGGKTIIPRDLVGSDVPKTWAGVGDVRFLLERQENKRDVVKKAFFNDILQVVSSVDRQMTATEVNARQSERIISFFSSFIQFSFDFQTLLHRIVGLMYRNSMNATLPPNPPEEFFIRSADGASVEVNAPQIRYNGKIAQAFDRLQKTGLDQMVDFVLGFTKATGSPEMIKLLKPYQILRYLLDSSGAPPKVLISPDEYEAMVTSEQQQALLAQQTALAEQQASADQKNSQALLSQMQALAQTQK